MPFVPTVAVRAGAQRIAWAPFAAFALCLLILAVMFEREIAAAVAVWLTSTAYGHCFLVLPIAAWLAWERRDRLRASRSRPLAMAALLMLPCGLAWLCAERIGVMEGRQFAALFMVWVMALISLGPELARAMAIPLAYLVFLVPFGAFAVPALQQVTAGFVDAGLGLLDVPHIVDQVSIEIPEGTFRVAEACAGLRFLIASIAFGALYAATLYRSPVRRLLFLAASVVIPVFANGLRALGIVMLGHWRGSAEAGAVDHVLYGWLFFSIVILSLIVVGLPFREDGREAVIKARALPRTRRASARLRRDGQAPTDPRSLFASCALAVLLASLGPALSMALDRRARREPLPPVAATLLGHLDLPLGCLSRSPPADGLLRLRCPDAGIAVSVRFFGPHAGVGLLLPALRANDPSPRPDARGEVEDVAATTLRAEGGLWTLQSTDLPKQTTASAVWIGGHPFALDLRGRLTRARASLTGGASLPVVVTIAGTGSAARQTVEAMALSASPSIAAATRDPP